MLISTVYFRYGHLDCCLLLLFYMLTTSQADENFVDGLPNECRRFENVSPDFTNQSMWCQLVPSFEDMPQDVVEQLRQLDFYQCGFMHIPRDSLELVHHLKRLVIDCDLLEPGDHLSIEQGTFRSLDDLQSVTITRSNLLALNNDTFCHMNFLEDIDLSNNDISSIEDSGIFCSDTCLNKLNVSVPCDSSDFYYCKIAFRQLTELSLSDNNITVLKNYGLPCHLANLDRLHLDGNKIETVEPKALAFLANLKILSLGGNKLKNLADEVFEYTTSLSFLNLDNNLLQNIPKSIGKQSKLWALDLQFNRIQHIAADTFHGLAKLWEIRLSNNQLSYIESGSFRSQITMYSLFLENNRLEELSNGTLDGLTALNRLFLQNNKLTTVDNEAFRDLIVLQDLNLSNNHIGSVPNVRFMKKLVNLNLSGNSIKTVLPDTFNESTTLLKLHLDHNHIRSLNNYAFTNLTNIYAMNLSYNEIEYVHNDSFRNLPELNYLLLQHNKLTLEENLYKENGTWKMVVFDIEKLLILNLSSNSLSRFSFSWFPNTLEELYLKNNSISEVDVENTGCFRGFTMILPGQPHRVCPNPEYIHILDLSYNSLKDLRAMSFPTNLNMISLDHNIIETIEEGTFGELTDIKTITLHNNRMHTLKELKNNLFRLAEYKAVVTLANNPWLCDCELYWLKHNAGDSLFTVKDYDKIVCERLYHRGKPRSVLISAANDIEDFMCLFEDMSSRLNWCPWKGNERICKEKCPESCKCYRDFEIERTKVMNIDCSHGNLSVVPDGILLNTTTLLLDANDIRVIGSSNFTWYRSLIKLYLNDSNVEIIEDGAFSEVVQLQVLDLKDNKLADIQSDLFNNLTSLRQLDLSHNLLSNVSVETFESLKSLQILYLHDNRLTKFPVWSSFEQLSSLVTLSLHHNPLSCDCDYAQRFANWLTNNTKKLINVKDLTCESDDEHDSMSLVAFNASHCFPSTVSIVKERYVPILVGSLCAFVFLSLAILLIFIYRREMQVLIYSRYGVRLFHGNSDDSEEDSLKEFDAFISYSSLDEMFLVHQLIPGLEHIENPYHVCLHHRDFLAGGYITENILEAVAKSQRTLIILSENFVQSEFCRFEFKMAHLQMLRDRRKRIIVIILGDIPQQVDNEIKLYLKTNTYITWGERLFWQKLYFALPEPRSKSHQFSQLLDNAIHVNDE